MKANEHKRIEDADYAMIAQYERQLDHLINGHYLVGVGHSAVVALREWWERYTGKEARVNDNCANCLADFLTMVGDAYFKEKALRAELAAEKAQAAANVATPTGAIPITPAAARKAARIVKPKSK